jgi:hypothetical protein
LQQSFPAQGLGSTVSLRLSSSRQFLKQDAEHFFSSQVVRRSLSLFSLPLAQPQPVFTGCGHGRSLPPYALGRSLPPSAGLYRRTRIGQVFTALGRSLPPCNRSATAGFHWLCTRILLILALHLLARFLTIVFGCFPCLVSPCGRAGRRCAEEALLLLLLLLLLQLTLLQLMLLLLHLLPAF